MNPMNDKTTRKHRKKLLRDLRKVLPPLMSTDEQAMEAKALVKLVHPVSKWIWYLVEFDGERQFFGLVVGSCTELSTFYWSDLVEHENNCGALFEIDADFSPTTLRELDDKHYAEKGC
jgi:hypothetical protein